MHKRVVENILEAEMDAHLDNEKHKPPKKVNYRKLIWNQEDKSSFVENAIKVPRDRASSFEPTLVLKKHNIIDR